MSPRAQFPQTVAHSLCHYTPFSLYKGPHVPAWERAECITAFLSKANGHIHNFHPHIEWFQGIQPGFCNVSITNCGVEAYLSGLFPRKETTMHPSLIHQESCTPHSNDAISLPSADPIFCPKHQVLFLQCHFPAIPFTKSAAVIQWDAFWFVSTLLGHQFCRSFQNTPALCVFFIAHVGIMAGKLVGLAFQPFT